MVYASQNHSMESSNRKFLIVCASVFAIMCPGPGQDQNNLCSPHTVKIMVYIHLIFGHLFNIAIKMVNWLLDHNLMEPGN